MAWKYLLKFCKVTDKIHPQTHRKENIILKWYLNSAHLKFLAQLKYLMRVWLQKEKDIQDGYIFLLSW
jgi:hypothetical protein